MDSTEQARASRQNGMIKRFATWAKYQQGVLPRAMRHKKQIIVWADSKDQAGLLKIISLSSSCLRIFYIFEQSVI